MLFPTIILAVLISTVSSAGHLRLDLTPSTNCAIRIVTNILHAESYWLTMGEDWTTNILPLHQQDSIKVSFSIDGGAPEEQVYELKNAGVTERRVFTFNDVAVLVEATFECDEGFTGSKCQIVRGSRRMRSKTKTTTAAVPTSSTTTIHVEAEPTGTVSTKTILILVSVLILDVILITLLAVCYFTNRRKQEVLIDPTVTCETPEMKKKDTSMDSGISTGTPRYTAEPSTAIAVSPC